MSRRSGYALAAIAAMALYCVAYLVAWSFVWRVPAVERDGMEGMFVFFLTLPWSLLAGLGGKTIVNAGAVVNGIVASVLVVSRLRRRCPPRTP